MVRPLQVSVDLCAEKPTRERVVRVASDASSTAVFYGREGRAGIGAIVRTGPTHDARIAISESRCTHGRHVGGTRRGSTSKRYRESRCGATLMAGVPNTFDVMNLDRPCAAPEWSALRRADRAARVAPVRLRRDDPCIGAERRGNTLVSLHLDNITRLDSCFRARRFRPDPGTACADHGNVCHPPQGECR